MKPKNDKVWKCQGVTCRYIKKLKRSKLVKKCLLMKKEQKVINVWKGLVVWRKLGGDGDLPSGLWENLSNYSYPPKGSHRTIFNMGNIIWEIKYGNTLWEIQYEKHNRGNISNINLFNFSYQPKGSHHTIFNMENKIWEM